MKKIVQKAIENLDTDVIGPLSKSLDTALKDEAHLKTVLSLLKLPQSISDQIFVHKFKKCFVASNLNKKDLRSLDKKLSGGRKARFWKLIFTSIQSHDDEVRSELVGKIIAAFARSRITYDEATRMIHASNRVGVDNLIYLKNCYLDNPRGMPGYARQEFATLGLLGIDDSRIGTWSNVGGPAYPLMEFGAKYVGAIFDYPSYPYNKKLRVGEARLVGAQKVDSSADRIVLPIDEAVKKGYWYGEAALVLRRGKKLLLTKNGPVIVSGPIYAGEHGEKTLANVTGEDESKFQPVYIERDEARRVHVHYYLMDLAKNSKLIQREGSWVAYTGSAKDLTANQGLASAIVKFDEVAKEQKAVKRV